MPTDERELWQLLHALDDPDHLEFPADHDHHRAQARFEQLARRLHLDFADQTHTDRHVEDASLQGRIDIAAPATATGRPLAVLISNFGGLAVLTIDNPGVWSDAEAAQLLHPDDARRIHTALADLGYTLIPEQPLWQPYDGVCDPAAFTPSPATWWTRYFDYL